MIKTYYPDENERNFTVTKIMHKRPVGHENYSGVPQLGSGNPSFREKEESTKPKRKPSKKTTKKKKCDCDKK
jgi:hypothetical protein